MRLTGFVSIIAFFVVAMVTTVAYAETMDDLQFRVVALGNLNADAIADIRSMTDVVASREWFVRWNPDALLGAQWEARCRVSVQQASDIVTNWRWTNSNRSSVHIATPPEDVFNDHLSFVPLETIGHIEALNARIPPVARKFRLMGDTDPAREFVREYLSILEAFKAALAQLNALLVSAPVNSAVKATVTSTVQRMNEAVSAGVTQLHGNGVVPMANYVWSYPRTAGTPPGVSPAPNAYPQMNFGYGSSYNLQNAYSSNRLSAELAQTLAFIFPRRGLSPTKQEVYAAYAKLAVNHLEEMLAHNIASEVTNEVQRRYAQGSSWNTWNGAGADNYYAPDTVRGDVRVPPTSKLPPTSNIARQRRSRRPTSGAKVEMPVRSVTYFEEV